MNKILQEIRKRLFLLRNGASSSSMRQKGMDYKINFGVSIPGLKEIAVDYFPNTELSNQLWNTNTRELKLLAVFIQEPKEFRQAEEWVHSINNIELAEQLSMHLLSKIPDAGQKASQWIQSDKLYVRIVGFLVYMRLFMQSYSLKDEEYNSYFYALFDALSDDSSLLQNAALNSLKHLGKQSVLNAKTIIAECHQTSVISEQIKFRLIEDLNSEFDYYF
jgi:Predicted DNA alkylation repair enzyme